jgi:uncharacterized protein (DUF362 family)
MDHELKRRYFLKTAAIASGALTLVPGWAAEKSRIAVAQGDDPVANLDAVIEGMGGMEQFVKDGDRVVLLPNPQGRGAGTSTKAELVAGVVTRCLKAGARDVSVCSIHDAARWNPTGIIEAVERAGGKMVYPQSAGDWMEVKVVKGKILKKARIIRRALENDVLINMPIAKQHDSARFTCTLKNLMGFNQDNTSFHNGSAHLQRCIVDLASVFAPDLCIVDASTILIENGPFGPGKTESPNKVFAGTDMVAIDALCCGLIDLAPQDIPHIMDAHRIGLGSIDLSRVRIKTIVT